MSSNFLYFWSEHFTQAARTRADPVHPELSLHQEQWSSLLEGLTAARCQLWADKTYDRVSNNYLYLYQDSDYIKIANEAWTEAVALAELADGWKEEKVDKNSVCV